jgi:hypothetical protein
MKKYLSILSVMTLSYMSSVPLTLANKEENKGNSEESIQKESVEDYYYLFDKKTNDHKFAPEEFSEDQVNILMSGKDKEDGISLKIGHKIISITQEDAKVLYGASPSSLQNNYLRKGFNKRITFKSLKIIQKGTGYILHKIEANYEAEGYGYMSNPKYDFKMSIAEDKEWLGKQQAGSLRETVGYFALIKRGSPEDYNVKSKDLVDFVNEQKDARRGTIMDAYVNLALFGVHQEKREGLGDKAYKDLFKKDFEDKSLEEVIKYVDKRIENIRNIVAKELDISIVNDLGHVSADYEGVKKEAKEKAKDKYFNEFLNERENHIDYIVRYWRDLEGMVYFE